QRNPAGFGKWRGNADGSRQMQGVQRVKRQGHGGSPESGKSGMVLDSPGNTKSEKRKVEVGSRRIREVAMGGAGVRRLIQKRPSAPTDADVVQKGVRVEEVFRHSRTGARIGTFSVLRVLHRITEHVEQSVIVGEQPRNTTRHVRRNLKSPRILRQ